MEANTIFPLIERLNKRKFSYLYAQPEWLDKIKLNQHQKALLNFARQRQLKIQGLDSLIQSSINTEFKLADTQSAFASLLNYSSQELLNFTGIFSFYIFNLLIQEILVAQINFEPGLSDYFQSLQPEFNKTGLMYKNTLTPVMNSLAKIYSMALSRYEHLNHSQVVSFGYFCLISLLHRKASNQMLAVLQLQVPVSFTQFSKFTIEHKDQVSAKQLALLLQYIQSV